MREDTTKAFAALVQSVDHDFSQDSDSAKRFELAGWRKAATFRPRDGADVFARVTQSANACRNVCRLVIAKGFSAADYSSRGGPVVQSGEELYLMTIRVGAEMWQRQTVMRCLAEGKISEALSFACDVKSEDVEKALRARTWLAAEVQDFSPEKISKAKALEIIRGIARIMGWSEIANDDRCEATS